MLKLGVVIPSNRPDRFFGGFLPSLHNLAPIADATKFLLYAQRPWTTPEIRLAEKKLRNAGFDVATDLVRAFPRPVNIAAIRELSADLDRTRDVYVFLDDDMRFKAGTPQYRRSAGQRYAECLDYLARFPRCGAVMCRGFLGGYKRRYRIQPLWHAIYSTAQGLFLRNLGNDDAVILPAWSRYSRGSLEEIAAVYAQIEQGRFVAGAMNVPVLHRVPRISTDVSEEDMHNAELVKRGLQRVIRDRYGDEKWRWDQKRIPRRLRELYCENGGDPLLFSQPRTWSIDYE